MFISNTLTNHSQIHAKLSALFYIKADTIVGFNFVDFQITLAHYTENLVLRFKNDACKNHIIVDQNLISFIKHNYSEEKKIFEIRIKVNSKRYEMEEEETIIARLIEFINDEDEVYLKWDSNIKNSYPTTISTINVTNFYDLRFKDFKCTQYISESADGHTFFLDIELTDFIVNTEL